MTDKQKLEAILEAVKKERDRLARNGAYSYAIHACVKDLYTKLKAIAELEEDQ